LVDKAERAVVQAVARAAHQLRVEFEAQRLVLVLLDPVLGLAAAAQHGQPHAGFAAERLVVDKVEDLLPVDPDQPVAGAKAEALGQAARLYPADPVVHWLSTPPVLWGMPKVSSSVLR